MAEYCIIANVVDSVTGALHQVTVESHTPPSTGETVLGVRLNGTEIPETHEFYTQAVKFWLAYCDAFAGITDLDGYVFDLAMQPLQDMLKEAPRA